MRDDRITSIRMRYQGILSRIAETAAGSGRSPSDVKLVVVSKSQPLETLQAAVAAGISVFGENYAEEAVRKILALQETALEWHMIGHVQSRKAELVARHFTMLHSLDSLKLANRLDRICAGLGKQIPVLLEFNVSGEESKFGFPAWNEQHWQDLEPLIEEILVLPNLRVQGLMTMPPFFEDPEFTRPFFKRLGRLQAFLNRRFPQADWCELSMGTSIDYVAAIQEGSTFVRVGQAILGPRKI
jgi:PLP dependent protein